MLLIHLVSEPSVVFEQYLETQFALNEVIVGNTQNNPFLLESTYGCVLLLMNQDQGKCF